jgi:NAD(P) transhydrogenase
VPPDPRGHLAVDFRYRTNVPNIFAAGDAIGFPALAATSMEQGRVAVCHAFGFEYKKTVADLLPYGIYTIPEVSALGETEESCRQIGMSYVVGRARYADNARGKIAGDTEGLLKLIVERGTRRLVGVHVIGERATELVHIGQAVVHLGGTVDAFIEMVFNYPSLAEAYKYAAYDCLGALERN